MAWRLAKSLDKLRGQVNSLYPNRNKASDGTIGDAAHAAGQSDHNPNAQGVVTALDLTHDPDDLDVGKLADSLVDSRDPRIKYLIWNKQILIPSAGWHWQKYTGDNPHTKHIHISVNASNGDDSKDWSIGMDKLDLNMARVLAHGILGQNGLNGGKSALSGANDAFLNQNLVGKELTNKLIDGLYNSAEAKAYRDVFLPNATKVVLAKPNEAQQKLDNLKKAFTEAGL